MSSLFELIKDRFLPLHPHWVVNQNGGTTQHWFTNRQFSNNRFFVSVECDRVDIRLKWGKITHTRFMAGSPTFFEDLDLMIENLRCNGLLEGFHGQMFDVEIQNK